MAAYPTIMQAKDSTQIPMNHNKFDAASDGTVRGRTEASIDAYTFTIRHQHITETEKDSILSHYGTDKNSTFNFTWDTDGVVYTCAYMAKPKVVWMGEDVWNVESKMIGS